jgi:phosphoenolpyruvate synthase/pyruvate phosphate dikinase
MKFKLVILLLLNFGFSHSQVQSNEKIKEYVNSFKNDIRGTYKSIQWFCKDGSIRAPKDPCPDAIEGIQHATYKDQVIKLGKTNHLYFGQILAYTDKTDFWDTGNNHSRLKQYQIGKYLARIDDGWVNRKGQYYRGSVQIEDEEYWGLEFYKWLLSKDEVLQKNYYLLIQSLNDIPHQGDSNLSQLMRAQSKVLSDEFNKFMDLRVKIHSNPEPEDIDKTKQFKNNNQSLLSNALTLKFDELIETMTSFHKPINLNGLNSLINALPKDKPITKSLIDFTQNTALDTKSLVVNSSDMLLKLREQITELKNPNHRLQALRIAGNLNRIVFKSASEWTPTNLKEQLLKISALTKATAGVGGIELWEYEKIASILELPNSNQISLGELSNTMETARGVVEWSSAMVKANYQDIINTYTAFEPKAYSFIDDRIRSSVALQLGKTVSDLGTFIAKESSLTNKILNLTDQSSIRGLNPGYAFGELVVFNGNPDAIEVSSNKIYIFERAPADLKPVAGIATVAEGNLVSHVQLLARNLGIPNAVLSDENLNDLLAYNGKKVFYAVSNRGNVIIKAESEMTPTEKALFAKKERKDEKIAVPIKDIRLDESGILNLREVNAADSGKLCGPKAANLGELKSMFPERVVEGLVIPFGIFREHMDQMMPNQNKSYWVFLNDMFAEADQKRANGISEEEVENYQLRQLEILRGAIKSMPLKSGFETDIVDAFKNVLGNDIGKIPVFLRSDTNMEDLKDFTGAGLNLTIFNAVERNKILQGIKDVWASPYTERSFKWRQKYLTNPENVFPSILVIPSVDVDYSGVLITKGIQSGNDKDLTIAFSRGAGGAVDGQAAESYLLKMNGEVHLVSPSREAYHNTLPASGGTGKKLATFETPILNTENIQDIIALAKTTREKLDKPNSSANTAYDIELGFKDDKLWLFQIRPFVENKKALSSDYLKSITPSVDNSKKIPLNTTLPQ